MDKFRIMKRGNSYRMIIVNGWPFLLALFVFLSLRFLIRKPDLIEYCYSQRIYPVIAEFLTFFSKRVAFSIWDTFWILNLLIIICGIILTAIRKIRFGKFCLWSLQWLAILYSFFYFVWGFNYYRPSFEERIGWHSFRSDEMSYRQIFDTIILNANKNYTADSSANYRKLDELVEESYLKVSQGLGIKYPNGTRRTKTMLFSSIYAKLGLSGYFGPFFNEVHVNRYLLAMDYPFLLAHEKAHQFGITSEAEANLAAFVVCIGADDQRLKYSGYQSLLLYFLNDATHMNNYKNYLNKLDKRVLNDIRKRQNYYNKLQNKALSDIQTAANNTYLKANKIKKGVRNYDQVVSLVINWYYNSNYY